MQVTTRPYQDKHDLYRMLDFVVVDAGGDRRGYLHVGDVVWGMYHRTAYDPVRNIQLWEDHQGTLLGFAWHEDPDGVLLQVAPHLRGTGLLEAEMIAWGASRVDRSAPSSDGQLWTRVYDGDTQTVAYLAKMGWSRDETHSLKMRRALDAPVPDMELPAGFTVRPVSDEEEWAARVALHRAVWPGATMTLAAYQRLRAAPGFLPELDLVAVAPDGTFAAYCICWLDVVNGTGEFEPVGTHAAFRGQGLGKAVMHEGLGRLHALGARIARVTAFGDNVAAAKLYASMGFTIWDTEHLYSKPLDELAADATTAACDPRRLP